MPEPILADLPLHVAMERRQLALLKADLDTSRAIWETENEHLMLHINEAQESVAQAENALREAALELYHASGDKDRKPFSGVEVKQFTQLAYGDDAALKWAKEHGLALKLDKPAFEKIARSQNGLDDREGKRIATISLVPRAVLAVDMDAAIQGTQ